MLGYRGATTREIIKILTRDHNLYTVGNVKFHTRVGSGCVVTFHCTPKAGMSPHLNPQWRVAYFNAKGNKTWDHIAD